MRLARHAERRVATGAAQALRVCDVNRLTSTALCCAAVVAAAMPSASATAAPSQARATGPGEAGSGWGGPAWRPAAGDLERASFSHRKKAPRRKGVAQIGDGPCPGEEGGPPKVDFDITRRANEYGEPPQFAIGIVFFICVTGFDPEHEIDVVVISPSGKRRTLSESRDSHPENRYWMLFTYPPNGLGTYEVQAVQGATTASAQFMLVAPKGPNVELRQVEIRAGGSVQVVLSGFDPRERVNLYLYRATGYTNGGEETEPLRIYTRVRRVSRLRVGVRGFARRRIVVHRPGSYLISADGLANSGFGFEVTRR